MAVKDLELKVAKAEEKVAKTKKTVERHGLQLKKKIALLEKASGKTVNLTDMESFSKEDFAAIDLFKWDKETGESYAYYWEACDVSGKMRDIEDSKKKVAEAERILKGHIERLDKEINKENFINESIPQVIKDFLQDWKEKSYDWHIKRYEAYKEFSKKIEAEAKEAKREVGVEDGMFPTKAQEELLKEQRLDYKTVQARKANFAGGAVLHMDSIYNEDERLAWLNKMLEKDKKYKMLDLIERITYVVGEITDASNLRISDAGNLNGIIKGSKADAKVETIGAGGYNIQGFHFRTLVNKIK